ncbi:hapless 2-like [Dendronephthya gigantea]|uniref:hapless 2-like n=1 Tax=Dendronephthya gigantea TaxID=151771 RepID=UPI001069A3DF|nr:hapless 2-like [Dendronephthya gigantea]
MCVRDKNRDPFNVVDGKSCDKKLVITKSVTAGEKESEMIYVNVSRVRDEVNRDEARLYNPFIITITSSPMHIIYPYTLEGTVNNKPYETSKREYWCQDGAATHDADDFSCKIQYDITTGKRIWDSQGFCCRCSFMEDMHKSQGGRYHRGNTVCGNKFHIPLIHQLFKNRKRQSAHCMNYDNLWYNVHKIGGYRIWFKIFVKAYDLVEEERDGKRYQKLVDGGQIELSNFKTSGHGVHGRLLASMIGMFESDTQIYSLTERYLFIPAGGSKINWLSHPQTRNGARDFMIIPKTLVAMKNSMESCNKIGVSFTAFRMQGAGMDGQDFGCLQRMGWCLHNQVKDYFEIDVKNREKGKRPLYFPERYGVVEGTTDDFKEDGSFALVYKAGKLGNIMISLEISADDIVLIYNKAGGTIVKAFATNFESLSQDGLLHVIVQNTGLVTADYHVTMKHCTRGIRRSPEEKASINAQSVHTFTFPLRTTVHASGKFMCTMNLWDSRHGLLDSANITFETTTACVCLQSCSCALALSLSDVVLTGTSVYRNFTDYKIGETYLTNPGNEFSLVGKLERDEMEYKFIVSDTMQFLEIVNDEMLLLTPAIPFNPEPFAETFTEAKVFEKITLEPQHVCLNEEIEFEFYDDHTTLTGDEESTSRYITKDDDIIDAQNVSAGSPASDLPPELPPKDYSRHDLDNEEVYEEPVIPYGSPVYEHHPSLRRNQLD